MKYEKITQYSGKLNPGKWYPEKQPGDGSEESPFVVPYVVFDDTVENFINDFYILYDSLYENNDYFQILEDNGIPLGDGLKDIDVKNLEDEIIMTVMLAVIRQDKFCEGVINEFIKNGCFEKWLQELKGRDK